MQPTTYRGLPSLCRGVSCPAKLSIVEPICLKFVSFVRRQWSLGIPQPLFNNPEFLVGRPFRISSLLQRLKTKTGKLSIDTVHDRTREQHPTPVFIVEYNVQVRAKVAYLLPNASAPKRFWLDILTLVPPHIPQIQDLI